MDQTINNTPDARTCLRNDTRGSYYIYNIEHRILSFLKGHIIIYYTYENVDLVDSLRDQYYLVYCH